MTYQTNTYYPEIFGFDLEVEATVEYTTDEGTVPHDAGDLTVTHTEITDVTIDSLDGIDEEIVPAFLELRKPDVGFHGKTKSIAELIKEHIEKEFELE